MSTFLYNVGPGKISTPNRGGKTGEAPFAVGSQVRLRNCAGPSGTVKGIKRPWVLVKWLDQPRVMRHRPASLVAAGEVDAQPAKENRYLKMLRRIDADNNKRSNNF